MMLKDGRSETFAVETIQWIGDSVTVHGNQTFYKAFSLRNQVTMKSKLYSLGDVVYVRHMDDYERMSFLEIYMLWELKGVKYLSVRAYYFPEDTVEGKFPEQGQDEVLCLEGEVVMTCREFLQFVANTHPESKDLPEPKILSFLGYCRSCAMRRRLGERLVDYVSHPLFSALGGVHPRFRILFCRDTVQDRELYKLWKCQNYYREVPSKKHASSRKRIKINLSESNDDSSISDAGENPYKANGKSRRGKGSIRNSKSNCSRASDKQPAVHPITEITEEECEVDVEDTKIHTVISSSRVLANNTPQHSVHRPPEPTNSSAAGGQSNLMPNVKDIKLPTNFLSTQTTPQQLDIIVRQLSHELTRIQEAKNTQRKVKYLMKR
ncbi:AT-rich interactive domain-containing protein 5B-like isoform X2 [Bolinopsis microptera]|uniref:AT-rich interactive domain-containing protein 5B-like isoform X2 n=1 Tax=Bolinopsis microptera TaxID=2820187 RepID=UPI003079BD9D